MTTSGGSGTFLVRAFGWGMLAFLVAFMTNAILTIWMDFPGAGSVLAAGGPTTQGIIQAAIYLGLPLIGILHVLRSAGTPLRADATRVSNFNAFLVRAAFWVVLLVGAGDAVISFLRVEGMLEGLVGAQLAGDLGRSQFRGMNVHVPLVVLGIVIGAVTRGLSVVWLAFLVVLAELLIVILRFIFSYEQAFMADLVRFWYGALFLFASAYTLLEDAHVRVDLLYAGFSRRAKGLVNGWGSILLGMTLCWTILVIGFGSKASIIASPILVFEVTQAGFGMYVKYFMAGFLGVFAITMLLQFVAQLFDAFADRRGEPGAHEAHSEMM
ncbi:TRAP transporter small permease subunit [Limibaculum sp. FT325]|uniref:TRAP transporter small permease subunit n=1 Tax=Thermohalobaculum sediminis TaxID=2939436 RepID=UPI0020BE2399|nr:TRAP transporter small permease subunit [Limibaculum sediminis]MCL5779031.1 TRAP transporter small permease subunit [Limibaculum sediminis]